MYARGDRSNGQCVTVKMTTEMLTSHGHSMCDICCIYVSRSYGDVGAAFCVTLRSVTLTLS